MTTKSALVLVDLQNDFMPGGSLAVPDGDAVVKVANQLSSIFPVVVATQDWHPANHGSFAASHPGKKIGDMTTLGGLPQMLWPVHCVQGTHGAGFHPDLDTTKITAVFHKGTDASIESYSGFFDNAKKRATGLNDFLRQKGITDVYVGGLATDYCVLYTVLAACELGYKTFVIKDLCRGIDADKNDCIVAYTDMIKAGATIILSKDL